MTETCGSAEYGVNLYDTAADSVAQVVASGFSDTGIYVGEHHRHGTGEVVRHQQREHRQRGRHHRGGLRDDAQRPRRQRRTRQRGRSGRPAHERRVFVRVEHGERNGTYGIQADACSDKNLIKFNTAKGNQFDLANMGTNNCFKNNKYQTHEGTIGRLRRRPRCAPTGAVKLQLERPAGAPVLAVVALHEALVDEVPAERRDVRMPARKRRFTSRSG